MGKVQVLSGDCILVMQAFPDNTFDSIVTDPPYGLEFMGKSWDSYTSNGYQDWCERWASECLRLLKPGGHLLAFGGTRTYHRMACGIEDAGFDIRDSLHWVYGSGFPKSMNIGKAVDSTELFGGSNTRNLKKTNDVRPGKGRTRGSTTNNGIMGDSQHGKVTRDEPATEHGKQWEGWGTALKPAHEPIVMARKPLSGKTVAANVLVYGTGGLNIDGTRVPTADRWEATGRRSDAGSSLAGSVDGSLNVSVSSTHEGGRWPANILLTHTPDCCPLGVKQVKGNTGGTGNNPGSVYGARSNIGVKVHGYTDDHGMETVESWDCAPGCPVAELDRQSGMLTSGTGAVKRNSGKGYHPDVFGSESRAVGTPMVTHGDSGGASRFFPVFRYQAKAPSRERPKDEVTHPTVKPLELMRWLVRLVTPPDGIVLDPFAGSGTTGEACAEEGFRCVLVEREPGYLRLIRKRLDSRVPTLWD